MEKTIIEATRRTVIGKKVGALRREGKLPGVIYGHNVEPTPILMDLREASRTLAPLSQSHIVTIVLEGAEHAALVREKQKDYILNILKHVDFQVVSLSEKIRTMVTVDIVGTSPAVKNFNGVVVTEVADGSPAATAGLRRGMLITHVDRQPIRTPKEFATAVSRSPGPVPIRIAGDEKTPIRLVGPAM